MNQPKTRGETIALLREQLGRRDLEPEAIDRGVVLALPRIGADAVARRVSGEPVALAELVEVIVAAVAPAAPETHDVAPTATTPPVDFLRSLRARLIAERAAAAAASAGIDALAERLENPLNRIDPGR
jgi:hypothetical protein